MTIIFKFLAFIFTAFISAVSGNKKVLLTNVQTLTLYKDQYTTGHRSSPVPQLKCLGGTAGCSAFVPNVVQCYNKGTDGFDVQWECKTEMGSAYKFGSIQVTCEGYDHPDDPYITKGSCGLEYTIDYAPGGHNNREPGSYTMKPPKKSSLLADIVFWIIVCLLLFILYRTFIAPATSGVPPRAPSGGSDGGSWPGGGGGGGGGPPPPGFRPNYYPADDSCSGSYGNNFGGSRGSPGGTGGSGFWTGLGAGGLLGYLMGNRGTGGDYYGNRRSFWDSAGPSYAGSRGSSWSPGSGLGTSGATRSTSGFGGTRRR